VPSPFLTTETNLANVQAAKNLHDTLTVGPRVRRRDEKLNKQLVPGFDSMGRSYFRSHDPAGGNQDFLLRRKEQDLKYGVRSINQVRSDRGLETVPGARSSGCHRATPRQASSSAARTVARALAEPKPGDREERSEGGTPDGRGLR
jgi:hypothetical protein